MRLALFVYSWSAVLTAADLPVVHYRGEIAHLRTDLDARSSVNFGFAKAVADEGGGVHFEGRDDAGGTWRALAPISGGIGFTTVWQADFDRNSRQDLMIVAAFPANGRCVDPVTVTFLMTDSRGRPTPWVIRTHMPRKNGDRFPYSPPILADFNHDGRAEFVVTDCEYSNPPRSGEDRRITGIFEARDALWRSIRPADLSPYTDLVRRKQIFRAGEDELVPTEQARWTDAGSAPSVEGSSPLQIAEVVPRSPECRGLRFGPVVNGKLLPRESDPCDELGKNRIRLTNGTVCYGWPTVVFDQPAKREIVAGSEEVVPLLREIAARKLDIVLSGQTELGHCSPVVLSTQISK